MEIIVYSVQYNYIASTLMHSVKYNYINEMCDLNHAPFKVTYT